MDNKKAIKATKNGAIAAFVSAGITFLYVFIAVFNNADGYMGFWNDTSMFFDVIFILICGFGMRRQSRAAAIAIFIYFIFSKIYIGIETGKMTSSGVAMVVLYFYGRAIQGAFAYHKIQKKENPNYKLAPKWMYYVGIPVGVLMSILMVFGMMATVGVVPSVTVVTGSEMNSKDILLLTEEGIIHQNDKIEFFYSDSYSSILKSGNILTDNRVVVYTQEEGSLQIYELPFQDIVSVELIKQGNYLNDSIYKVHSFQEDAWIRLILSTEDQKDVAFVEALRKRIKKPNNNQVQQRDKLGSSKPSEIYRNNNEAVVLVRSYDKSGNLLGFGSGFNMREDGVIVTNRHVVMSGSLFLDIKFPKHGTYEDVYVAGISPVLEDYIILRVDGKNLPSVNMSNRTEYDIGEEVVTIGNPQGLLNSLSEGVVSGKRVDTDYEYYQMTAPISHGSSGGAVFDQNGYLVGISTAILGEGQNLNFFLPIHRVNNAETFDPALSIEQFNSLCRSRAEEYKDVGDKYLLSTDYKQANINYEMSLKYYDNDADAYYANSEAKYQLGLEDEALADLIAAASLYYLNGEKGKLLNVKKRAEEMSLPAEVVDTFDMQSMENILKNQEKGEGLEKKFISKDNQTKEVQPLKNKLTENITPPLPKESQGEDKPPANKNLDDLKPKEEKIINITKDDILKKLGKPDSVEKWSVNERWHYGSSYVDFENGIYTRYYDPPSKDGLKK